MNKRRVVLYGRSVILGAIEASLQRYARLELVCLAPPLPTTRELGALAPDVIIFDLEAARPEAAISWLETRPSLLLIGIDAGSDRMLLWAGQQARALAMQDVLQAIDGLPAASGQAAPRPSPLDRLRRSISALTARPRIATRAQKLAGAAAGLGIALFLAWSLAQPVQCGASSPGMWLAFAAGAALGGVLIGLWVRCGRRKRGTYNTQNPRSSTPKGA